MSRLETLRQLRTDLSAQVGRLEAAIAVAKELQMPSATAKLNDAIFAAETALYEVEQAVREFLGDGQDV